MARKILIALCVLFVMPVFVITGCDEVQENLAPKSSFIADFSCEYRKMNITGKLSASGKKLINISLDSPNTVSYNFFTQQNLILKQNSVIITVKKKFKEANSMDSCDSRSRSTHNDGYRLGSYFRCL